MKIETKFNIEDYVYYGDENSYDLVKIIDIKISFLLDKIFIIYKIDFEHEKPFKYPDHKKYEDVGEGYLYASPHSLIEMQIARCEKEIENKNKKIEELKAQLKSLPE
jgi:hypothetical protein